MHAVGSVPAGVRSRQFDAARGRFLDWLAGSPALGPYLKQTRVVFDAQNATRDWGTTTHRGLIVTFSFRQTADDVIENDLELAANAQKIRVVSNDHRLQSAARRAKAKPMTCEEFVDWLIEPDKPGGAGPKDHPVPPPEKPNPDAGELEEYLRIFGEAKPRR